MNNPLKNLEAHCRTILAYQKFSTTFPGPIIRDVGTMLDFIGPSGLHSGSKLGNLPSRVLPELNARLSNPIHLRLKRVLLRDYPNIAGLFILLRVMRLVVIENDLLQVEPRNRALWENLNPAEKYFALIEAWLLFAESGVVSGKADARNASQFLLNMAFLAKAETNAWTDCDIGFHNDPTGLQTWNTQLQISLGLADFTSGTPHSRRSENGWAAAAYRRTHWGSAFLWRTFEAFPGCVDAQLRLTCLPENAGFGMFQSAFQECFPECMRPFVLTSRQSASGLHIFKVDLDPEFYDPRWRRMAVPSRSTLHALVCAILESFKLEERLYQIRFRDSLGKRRVYRHPAASEGPFADEPRLGDLDLHPAQTLELDYDLGDWKFFVRLERIDPLDPDTKTIRVLEKHGQPPLQEADGDEL